MLLLDMIPRYLREVREYEAIFDVFDMQFDSIGNRLEYLLKQSVIMSADESRVSEWETFLQIQRQGNLHQRRQYIVATLTSVGKLNERKIEDIVNIYSEGGGCIIDVTDSSIIVKVKPPVGSEQFLFPDVERTLNRMKPAHLALSVVRYYATVGIIEGRFTTVEEVERKFATINDLERWVDT